jgi:two-component system, chemotaxis family, CheB/CheR fusion protein
MYFNHEAQVKILIRFHFALKNFGFIFLGKAETLVSRSFLFAPVSIKHRVFTKGAKLESNDVLMLSNKNSQSSKSIISASQNIWQSAFETHPIAQLIVEPNGRLIGANESARALLNLSAKDLGYLLEKLPFVAHFEELESQFEQALRDRSQVSIKNILWSTAKSVHRLNIDIVPIYDSDRNFLGASLIFTNVTASNL